MEPLLRQGQGFVKHVLVCSSSEGNEHVDVDEVYLAEPLLRQDVWAAKLSNRSRKEATATDVRQYEKQFLEAKLLEHKS